MNPIRASPVGAFNVCQLSVAVRINWAAIAQTSWSRCPFVLAIWSVHWKQSTTQIVKLLNRIPGNRQLALHLSLLWNP